MSATQAVWDARYQAERADDVVNLAAFSPVVRDRLAANRKLLRGLGLRAPRILDIGGGTGRMARWYGLHDKPQDLEVVDISAQAVELARACGHGGRVCDITREPLPFPDSSFDLVLLEEVVEHIYDCRLVLNEAFRVLRPGGRLYLTTPNLAGLIDRTFLLRGKRPLAFAWDPDHIRAYTFSEVASLLRTAGFDVERQDSSGAYVALGSRFVRLPFVGRVRTLGQCILILGRRPQGERA